MVSLGINLLCLGVLRYSVTQQGRPERASLACLVVMLSQHPSHPYNLLRLCVQGDLVASYRSSYECLDGVFYSGVEGTNLTNVETTSVCL